MAMQQLTLPGEIVKKDNKLVRGKISIANVDGSRILANLIACVRQDDMQFKETYRIQVKDFLSDLGGGSYARIKGICEELAQATVKIEEPDPDSLMPYLRVYPFFSAITFRNGTISARFNWEMHHFLLDLRRCFTEINLIEYLSLPSLYSQRLFEILKSWSGLPEVILPVAELHEMLNAPESLQNDFAQFRRRVLEKAHKDIHKKTSLNFEWEPIKTGRSVEAVRFIFSGKQKALAEAETKKLKEKKQRRLQNQRISNAFTCATAKKGDCVVQDNKPIICKVCQQMAFCEDLQKRGGKPFNPYGSN